MRSTLALNTDSHDGVEKLNDASEMFNETSSFLLGSDSNGGVDGLEGGATDLKANWKSRRCGQVLPHLV